MICRNCLFENPSGLKFCGKCGAELTLACPSCGTINPSRFKFCGECGQRLISPGPGTSPRELSFSEKLDKIQRYLPYGLAEKILSQRGKIEGERKQITVMFCDMAGFMSLVDKIGPEEAYAMMDQIYEILIHKVHDYGGTVNELTGDGIVALFGAPLALEDAPQRAIRSALAIQSEIARFSDTLKNKAKTKRIRMRIGINTGPVVVGTLGNDLRIEFKAVGDTVNLAARIEGIAEPGSIYVTEDTFKLVEGYFRFETLGERKVRGKDKPVKVFRVIAPSSRRTRFEVTAERGLTPLVARSRELELLLEGFKDVKAWNGRAFSITADAGMGKSRLLYEFRKAVADDDVTFLEGNCLSYGRGMAYHPIIDALKGNFHIQESDEDSEIKEKVKKGLETLGMDEASTMPFFLELLSVKDSGIDSLPISPEARKERIIESLNTVMIRGSEKRPLVLAIEDLQWVDDGSEEVLRHLLGNISGARIMLIFTYRPEFVPSWGDISYHMQIELNRFCPQDSHTMVSHLLAPQRLESDLEDLILIQTGGIPLFIEEFVKALKVPGTIKLGRNGYYLAKDIHEIAVPSTIQEIVMSQVDALPEEAKKVLQTAAVIEREFSHELLWRVAGIPEDELLFHLSVLKDAELIYEQGLFPRSIYIFKHALTRDAVYASILSSRKKKIHEQIAVAIEELYEQKIDDYYGELTEHYAAAENYEDAAEYARLTAQKAEKTASMNDAIAFGRKRVAFLEKLPPRGDLQRKIIDARTDLGLYLIQLLHYREAREAIQPVITAVSEGPFRKRLPQVLIIMGSYESMVEENLSPAFRHFEKALRAAQEVGDTVSLIFGNWRCALPLSLNCELERAASHYQNVLGIMVRTNNLWGVSRAQSFLSLFNYFMNGRIGSAHLLSSEALWYAEESGDTYSKAIAYTAYGGSCFGKGFFEEATDRLSKAIDLCERLDFFIFEAFARWLLGEIYFEIGHYGASKDHFGKAVLLMERTGSIPSFLGACRTGLAMAKVMNNEKESDLDSLFAKIDTKGFRVFKGLRLRYLARLLLNVDDGSLSKAEEWIDKALAWHEHQHMAWWLGRTRLMNAELFTRRGDLPKAKEQLLKAIDIFKDCGADEWVTKTKEKLSRQKERPSVSPDQKTFS